MKSIKILAAAVLAAIAVGGQAEDVQPLAEEPHTSQQTEEMSNSLFKDDKFNLSFDKVRGKWTVKANVPNTTFADLANFAMQKCWNEYLARKLDRGGKTTLTDSDVKLVEFCIEVHARFLDTISFAMLDDLTKQSSVIMQNYVRILGRSDSSPYLSKSLEAEPPQAEDAMSCTYPELSRRFLKGQSPLRVSIKQWGEKFQREEPDEWDWIMIFGGVFGQKKDVDFGAFRKKCKNWLPRHNARTIETAEAWSVMETLANRYLKSLNRIYRQVEECAANLGLEDRKTLERAQLIIQGNGACVQECNRRFRGALYDMPLAFYSLRGYAGAYTNWHWHGDNDEEMYKAAKYMVIGIRGVSMIVNAGSFYSIDAYNSTVSFLKNKLGADEFDTLLSETKMYHVDMRTKDYEDNNPTDRLLPDKTKKK